VAEIFKPTRAEQFFESIPEFDVTKFVITHRWANYLDDVGEELNEVSATSTDSLIALEGTTNKIIGIVKNAENQIEDLTQFISALNRSRADIKNIENSLSDLNQLVAIPVTRAVENEDSTQFIAELIAQEKSLRAELSTLRQRVDDLEALHAN